jgi:aminopeptidase N
MKIVVYLLLPLLLVPGLASAEGAWPDPGAERAARARVQRRIERQRAEAARAVRQALHLRSGALRMAAYNPIDVTHTKVVFSADGAAGTIDTVIDVTIKALQNGVSRPVFLVTKLAAFAIEDQGGNPLVFSYVTQYGVGMATVTLPTALASGEETTLRFRAAGTPVCDASSGMLACTVSAEVVYFVGPNWIPAKAANSYADLYTSGAVDFEITTPPGFVAAATSDRVAVDDHGDHLVHRFEGLWAESIPSFAYAQYDVFTAHTRDDKPVATYIHSGSRDFGPAWAEICAAVVDFYGDTYAPYLYYKLDLVQTLDALGGGMGPQSAAFFYASLFDDDPAEPLSESIFSHEIAHSWWGGMVRMGDGDSPWLNEGLAEYSSRLTGYHLWPAHYTDEEYRLYFEMFRYFVPPESEVPLSSPNIYNDAWVYQLTTYYKGAHVLRMLQWYLGREPFFAGMQLYAATNTWETSHKPVEVADFKLAMETAAGVDLTEFFDAWVYGTGYPIYRWAAEFGRDGRQHTVRVRAEQIQEIVWSYPLPLEVTVWAGAPAQPRHFILTFDGLVADATFTVDLEPRAVKVDGASWIFGAKEPQLVGDVDGSNDIDGVDLLYVGWARGAQAMNQDPNYYLDADFDRNGAVDDADVAVVMDNFGQEGVIP